MIGQLHIATERLASKIAVQEGTRQLTYGELETWAAAVAGRLSFLGPVGGVVALCLPGSPEYVVGMLGVLRADRVFLPLGHRLPFERLPATLRRVRPDVYLTTASLVEEVRQQMLAGGANPACPLLCLGSAVPGSHTVEVLRLGDDDGGTSSSACLERRLPEDACYVMTTSGSTGVPKAILGSRKGLEQFLRWEIAEFDLGAEVRTSLLSAVTFDVSLRDILVPLLAGGTLCIPSEDLRLEASRLVDWLQGSRVTLCHMVPTLMRMVLQGLQSRSRGRMVLPDLRFLLLAGEQLYGDDVLAWRSTVGDHVELVNLYGPSETTLAKLFNRVTAEEAEKASSIPLGQPLPDTDVLVCRDGVASGVGEMGELFIRTKYPSLGYLDDDEATRRAFVPNPLNGDPRDIVYRTGDLGVRLPDGRIRFEGRADRQVKLGGNRVELGEIEVVLRQHPQVKEVAVDVRPGPGYELRLCAYVVGQCGVTPAEVLRRFVADRLPDYMVPSTFQSIESIPRTHSGKVDRTALPEPSKNRPDLQQPYEAPATPSEERLATIWRELLGLDQVGACDSFFDLGGTSLLAARLVTRLAAEWGRDITIVRVFEHPSIRPLAAFLDDPKAEAGGVTQVKKRMSRRRALHAHRDSPLSDVISS